MPSETERLPTLSELGPDLVRISILQRAVTLAVPFLCVAAYAVLAWRGWWIPAVAAVMYLSFITYASTSHDLVHRCVGLPPRVNDLFLAAIELLTLRSGHAYRVVHLHHHARFPADDDVEGSAAKVSWWRALLAGPLYQVRLCSWALRNAQRDRGWIVAEVVAVVLLLAAAAASVRWTPIPAVYAALVVAGSWIYPLMTATIPHDASGASELTQTRLFRGTVSAVVFQQHLYHLEHHLYPAVPHQNWAKLAVRLDPHFERAGLKPIKFGF